MGMLECHIYFTVLVYVDPGYLRRQPPQQSQAMKVLEHDRDKQRAMARHSARIDRVDAY